MFTGLILTDTQRLAAAMGEKHSEVLETLFSYVNGSKAYINWVMVDASDPMYADMNKEDWHAYASILNDYYFGLGLKDFGNFPLFIIGGEDVIPMPTAQNPLQASGGEFLSSDMLYCFDTQSGYSELQLVMDKPRFAVGRLPIANEYTLVDLQNYLEDCLARTSDGIHVRGAAMTTTESWLRASKEMMRDLPIASLSEEYVPLNERMIVSPLLDTSYQDMYDGYVHELKKVDFLVCNLHGSDEPGQPQFFGEDKEGTKKTIATQPSMLEQTCPLIFNTVACYGARYTGYEMDDSMLLMAMAYGTLLYCGACDTSFGGPEEDGVAREGRSELLMKLYNIYLHQGQPAGMALLKAKQDYYRTCHTFDSDERAMFTILEFNLFGCPILAMQPELPEDYRPLLLNNRIVANQSVTYQPKKSKPVWNSAYQAEDIHAYVQRLVDNNLTLIRQKVEKEVYQRLGLGKDSLRVVLSITQNNNEVGYQFVYRWSPQGVYSRMEMCCLVDTDMQGSIVEITRTK